METGSLDMKATLLSAGNCWGVRGKSFQSRILQFLICFISPQFLRYLFFNVTTMFHFKRRLLTDSLPDKTMNIHVFLDITWSVSAMGHSAVLSQQAGSAVTVLCSQKHGQNKYSNRHNVMILSGSYLSMTRSIRIRAWGIKRYTARLYILISAS
ncbi:hypothetical protein PoB_006888500 [Plakobranchus ocellatus]|uniref:Uncharacterized protein n=1 Tax=Plakobranchus ocellatus TaxID=259542 RepID=A0AAV4DED7_9GAST|nr:hypothetical protein PoB_006888500 [Plakobranchus ocellatus]